MVLVNVTDVNDNKPRFSLLTDPFVTYFNQLNPPGGVVTKATAYDADSGSHGAVTYRLEEATMGLFQIDNQSGVITAQKSAAAFRSESYFFTVVATDSSPPFHTSRSQVKVDVDKFSFSPNFSVTAHAKAVPENAHVGTTLVQLNPQHDDRRTLKFFLSSGNKDNALCIDTTGKLRVQRTLDRERTAVYYARVGIQRRFQVDLGPPVTISVTDVNDNAPRFLPDTFKVFVPENLPAGHVISNILAKDPDEGKLRYSIVNAENPKSKGLFTVKGVLATAVKLDREQMKQHVLTIRAEDSGKSSFSVLAQVVVIVQDENDNPPVFAADPFEVWVPFGSELDSPIFRLRAVDADRGKNGKIR